ncbi:PhnD/SsuA/transferrin family substrate-binding protein [Dongshaea marina]|uniref:PhnD/SsuA/transferrin family substrate-binding protein n=1 Tax=Dongshaea marina TaxID=2047966 RepID=UPI000D3E7F08|nr:PhnD/SsuA/transferrin family substrate-binding protein [Dongshaea marina]
MSSTLVKAVCTLLALSISSLSHAEIRMNFGVYTSDKPTVMIKMFRPILNELEQIMSDKLKQKVQIRIQVANNYQKGIDSISNAEVDFSRLGPASYIRSKQANPNIKLLAMESNHGRKFFYGVICVPQSSDISNVSQLKGKSFAFGNPLSTIGRYLSQLYLMQHGIYSDDLSRFSYLKRHDQVGMSVAAMKFDAGSLKEGTFNKLVSKGVKIKEIAKFKNVTKPWVASSNLQKDLLIVLKSSLFEIPKSIVEKNLGKQGFLDAKDSDYDEIRKSIMINTQFNNNIRNDS